MPEDAKEMWTQLAPEMVKAGILRSVDGPAFVIMAIHYAVAIDAARAVEGKAKVEKDTAHDDTERKHPLMQILKDNSAAFRSFATEFGMTPSSRGRTSPKLNESGNPLADFIGKQH